VAVFVDLQDRTLRAIGFTGEGCSILIASASMMTDRLWGATRADAVALVARFEALVRDGGGAEAPDAPPALGELAAFAALATFPGRVPCAMMPWLALRAALGGDDPESARHSIGKR
jgi:nitrogen fixation NifU-like protein